VNKKGLTTTPIYEIRIKGPLDRDWAVWFEGMNISLEEDGNTLISGPVVDQAALYGMLKKVHQIGMQLISINEIECLDKLKQKKEMNNNDYRSNNPN